jgi:long-chain acyl-CoA synthetase
MTQWHATALPALRHEAVYGDRVVRCFAERPASLHALLQNAVAQHAGSDAVVCGGTRWSYAALDAEVARIAAGLAAAGVARGERVLMFMGNRPEFVSVLFAIARLGAIAVPVGEREQMPGLAYMLQQCGACAIVFDEVLADRVPPAADVPALRLRIVAGSGAGAGRDAVAAIRAVAASRAGAGRDAVAGSDALSGSDAAAGPGAGALPLSALGAGLPLRTEPQPVQPQDTALILYTSGTTGRPKGAMLTHLNVAHSVRHYEVCMGLRQGDRSALAVPASHVTGLIAVIAAMVHVGGAIVVLPQFKAADFLFTMAAERVTHTLMVPAMYTLALMQPGVDAAALTHWRIGGYGGAPMPVATIDALGERWPSLVLINAYGATETCSPATMMPPGLTRAHADSVGLPLPCADLRVMDDAGHELPPGEAGELWIGGPMVVPGYWDNAEATAANFTAGYWHSGDLGSIDALGFVRLFDRKKDMLNRGGFKVYSVEVENTLMAFPGVVEAAVVGRPCPVLGERVHAFLHAPGVAPDDEAVRAFCRARLTDYKVPETITWSGAPLRRSATGKLLKRVMREGL